MRPAAGVECSLCRREKGHRCQAQIYVEAESAETGEPGTVALCMPCANDEPCTVDRVGAPPKPEDEIPMFEAVEDHVPVMPVIHRTAEELGLPDVLPPDPVVAREEELAKRKRAAQLHAVVEARAKIAAKLPQVKIIGGERVKMTPGVVMGPEMLNPEKRDAMPKGYEKVERNMQIVEAAREGIMVPEIARRFDTAKSAVYAVLKRHGVKAAAVRGNGKGERNELMVEAARNGRTVPEIATRFQIAQATVWGVLKARNVTPVAAPRGRRGPGVLVKTDAPPKKDGRERVRSTALALKPGQRGIEIGGAAQAAVDALLPEEVTFTVRMPVKEARRRLEQLTPAQMGVALRAVLQAGME